MDRDRIVDLRADAALGDLKIIMLTGSAPEMTVGRARESGVTLLLKPIAIGALKAAVDAAFQA